MAPALKVWVATGALCAGCALGAGRGLGSAAVLAATGSACIAVRRRPVVSLIGVAVAAFGLGAIDATVHSSEGLGLARAAASVPRCSVTGRVLEDVGALGTLVSIQTTSCDRGTGGSGVAIVSDPPGPPGTTIAGEGLLIPLDDDGLGFLLERLGARARLHDLEIRSADPPEGIQAFAETFRRTLERATAAAGDQSGALLRGLTIGDTSSIDERTIDDFRRSGLSHIVAVSGSNVAIVLGAVMFATGALSLRLRVATAGAALGMFVVVVGPDPSVLRAAAMGAIALTTIVAGYRARPLNALALAVIIVVAFRPGMVWSVGLQLSVAATAGLIVFTGPIMRRLDPLPRPVATLIAATIGAQLGVLPILAAVFGEVSVVAPFANVVAIPAVAPATILALLSGTVGLLWPGGGTALARLAEPFSAWILWVARTTGGWEAAVVDVPKGAVWIIAVSLVALAWFALRQPVASEA